MAITVEISNYDDVIEGMKDCQKDLAKGVKKAMNDMARRETHTVVKREVAKVYNVKQADVTGSPGRTKPWYEEIGSITLAGVKIPFYKLSYRGRGLTPVHFKMKPKVRPSGSNGGGVTWQPLKSGGRIPLTPLGQPAASAPFVGSRRGTSLPWVRRWPSRKPIDVVRTHLSVPQMVDNDKVQPFIQQEIDRRIEKKLNEIMS